VEQAFEESPRAVTNEEKDLLLLLSLFPVEQLQVLG
jgi:hypothetical protein